jgi:putative ATP-dependent endonuclease of the OLD family
LELQWSRYPDFKKDSIHFPQYRYLGWDFNLEDLKKIANDAMRGIIDRHTETLRTDAAKYSQDAEREVNEELARYVPQLVEDAPTLSGLKTRIFYDVKPTISDILINKSNADSDIHLDSQGEGVKRQIWFGLIRMAAARADISANPNRKLHIWCFDEPETHLFPAAQRKFLEATRKLANSSFQVLLSTHSTIFTDRTHLKWVHKATLRDGYTVIGNCKDPDDVFEALQVRNSDFLFYDKFLFVEGDTERVLIPGLFRRDKGVTLEECGVQLIPLGGKDARKRNHENVRKLLRGFQKVDEKIVTLLDNDAHLESGEKKFEGEGHYFMGRQDIDDQIPASIWIAVLKKCIPGVVISDKDVNDLKAGIPNDKKIQSGQKFHPKLKSLVLANAEGEEMSERIKEAFPSKGSQLGQLLLDEMVFQSVDTPEAIRCAFECLAPTAQSEGKQTEAPTNEGPE